MAANNDAQLHKQILNLQEEKLKIENNYKNRISLLESEIEDLSKNQDIAIERALNQAKNKLKGQGQKTKKAMQDQLKLKKDNEQKDWRLDDLKSRLEKAVSEEHKSA